MPDAVLLDWNMPVMDGYDFLGDCAACPAATQPKVVFCTTENDVAHIARALHAGANEYIMKPFDKDIVDGEVPGSRADLSDSSPEARTVLRRLFAADRFSLSS